MEDKIQELISSREKFNAFVYIPVEEAILEFEKRQSKDLRDKVSALLPAGVPKVLSEGKHAVVFRQLISPNYELRRFISLVDGLDGFVPTFFEYANDKYVDNNEWKYHLGKMLFYAGRGKKGGEKITRKTIIKFNISRGKPISDIMTLWGQTLVDFHHEFFKHIFDEKTKKTISFDASDWFHNSGGSAKEYYKDFLTLFVSHGILFENFMLDVKELDFTKEIFLPALIEVIDKTGKKPLIVALEPTDIESHLFWMCHPIETKKFVDDKLNLV